MSISLGAVIYVALKPVFKIYLILGVGFLLAKYQIVGVEAARSVSNMVVNAILPCLVFNKIVGNIQARDIKEIGTIVLSAVILFALGGVFALMIKFILPVPKKWVWGVIFAGLFPNISDLPIAYVQSMGTGIIFSADNVDKGVAYCCIFLTAQSFMMMNFGMFRLVGLDFRESPTDIENSTSFSDERQNDDQQSTKDSDDSKSIKTGKGKQNENDSALDPRYFNVTSTGRSSSLSDNPIEMSDLHSLSESDLASEDQLDNDRPQLFRKNTSNITEQGTSNGSTGAKKTYSNMSHTTGSTLYRTASLTRDASNTNSLASHSMQANRVRSRRRSQTINDVISEYSVADRVRTGELDLRRPLTLTADIGEENTALANDELESHTSASDDEAFAAPENDTNSMHLVKTATNKSLRKMDTWFQRHNLGQLEYVLINFFRPASLGALLGIICSMIPWVQALFVNTYVHVHNAPDGLPVLNFIMDATEYIGNACVPLGLLLLGGTIARLEVKSIPQGFIFVAIAMATIRLAVIPIIGVLWTNKIFNMNWIESDIAKLVIILTFAMPSATAQIYFTAFFTPMEGPHLQMDCLSVLFVVQYIFLFITLPFVVSYTLKVDLKY
ncbi:hypothetical protein KDRO_D07400 [Kluyveromyces lactis]|nr:hypothetical protein KDRO_D07400 [Kluyveromyces lactis]